MKQILILTALLTLTACQKPAAMSEDVRARKTAMRELGLALENAQNAISQNQLDTLKNEAQILADSHKIWQNFANSQHIGGAKPNLWTDGGFSTKTNEFDNHTQALLIAVQSGDMTAAQSALDAVNGECKSCHQSYKR